MPEGEGCPWLFNNIMKYLSSLELSTLPNTMLFLMGAQWLPQVQKSHLLKATSQGQSNKRGYTSSLCLFMRCGNFCRGPPPQAFLHWAELLSHAHFLTGHWQGSRIIMAGLKYSGFTLPIQWGWGGNQHSLKLMTTEYLDKTRIWLICKKGKCLLGKQLTVSAMISYTQFPVIKPLGDLKLVMNKILAFVNMDVCCLWIASRTLAFNVTSKIPSAPYLYILEWLKNQTDSFWAPG